MSEQPRRPRPWYVNDRLCDDWLTIERQGGDLRMLKSLKIARSIIVNLGIIIITSLALYYGGRPDLFGALGLLTLAAYNGIEVVDYISLMQAIVEAQETDTDE
jgi:hypothetical protein